MKKCQKFHNNNGTNSVINSSSAIFLFDNVLSKSYNNSFVSGFSIDSTDSTGISKIKTYTDNNLSYVGESNIKNGTIENIIFRPSSYRKEFIIEKDILSNLHISFYYPDGKKIKLQNDILTLKNITSTHVNITTSNYSISGNVVTISSDVLNTKIRKGLFINNSTNFDDNTFILYLDKTNPTTKFLTNNNSLAQDASKDLTLESRRLELRMNEYFSSDEYRLGDRIYLKNINLSVYNDELKIFLERDEGHTIISMYSIDSNDNILISPEYYNVIEILPKFYKNDGYSTETEYFNLNTLNGSVKDISDGKLINLDNQAIVNFTINCIN